MSGKSANRPNFFQAVALPLAFALYMAGYPSARAITEAEAVDELIAVLGNSLPCPRYSLAWLGDPPTRIEHRCAASTAEALTLGETALLNGVRYLIDIVAARARYMSVYRSRGTPTPAVVLAQFLSSLTALEQSTPPEYPVSPLMVYSKGIVGPASPTAAFTQERPWGVPTIMIFAR